MDIFVSVMDALTSKNNVVEYHNYHKQPHLYSYVADHQTPKGRLIWDMETFLIGNKQCARLMEVKNTKYISEPIYYHLVNDSPFKDDRLSFIMAMKNMSYYEIISVDEAQNKNTKGIYIGSTDLMKNSFFLYVEKGVGITFNERNMLISFLSQKRNFERAARKIKNKDEYDHFHPYGINRSLKVNGKFWTTEIV